MSINFLAILVAALSTLPVGFIWYNPKVFGNLWMRESGMTEDKAKSGNMLKISAPPLCLPFSLPLRYNLW
ncbi:Protein of unknown function [Flavobacterium caeni]|uniref:DUF1761 domain-containing protein n=1 Tax=Flavobacterium caeni TaxID=490189 RepID=A0A1G5I2J1_9FLAO|nr:Protein of unknown function [Flavobacterium caeni]